MINTPTYLTGVELLVFMQYFCYCYTIYHTSDYLNCWQLIAVFMYLWRSVTWGWNVQRYRDFSLLFLGWITKYPLDEETTCGMETMIPRHALYNKVTVHAIYKLLIQAINRQKWNSWSKYAFIMLGDCSCYLDSIVLWMAHSEWLLTFYILMEMTQI